MAKMTPMASNDPSAKAPGQLIRQLLDDRGWKQKVLATIMGLSEPAVNLMIAGRRGLNAETALALEMVFGVPAEQFLQLQTNFDLAKARFLAPPDPALARRAMLFGAFPVAEMIRRGWIAVPDMRDTSQVEAGAARFFDVPTAADIPALPHAAKKTGDQPTTATQLAWLYRVRSVARAMLAPTYSPAALRALLPRLRALLLDPDDARRVPRLLLDCGVRFVVVEQLSGAKIDGVCCWLDDAPVIGMSLRLDRLDNFWFVLRHEIEHILREHGKGIVIVDAELEGGSTLDLSLHEEEQQANTAAADFCVPAAEMDDFILRKRPFFADKDIVNFARRIKVHPSLVAGQLRHRLGKWDRFGGHTAPVRSAVVDNARTDGWGTVAPLTN